MPDELLGWPVRTFRTPAGVPFGTVTLVHVEPTRYGPMLVAVGAIVGVLERRSPDTAAVGAIVGVLERRSPDTADPPDTARRDL